MMLGVLEMTGTGEKGDDNLEIRVSISISFALSYW